MAEGRERAVWRHTAQLTCAMVEPHRNEDENPTPYTPLDFYPFDDDTPAGQATATIADVRRAMMGW